MGFRDSKRGVHCNFSVNERTQHTKIKLNLIGRRGVLHTLNTLTHNSRVITLATNSHKQRDIVHVVFSKSAHLEPKLTPVVPPKSWYIS